MSIASTTALAFVVTAVVAPLTLVALRRRAVFDVPSDRSSHTVPLPRGIGVALAVGGFAALAAAGDLNGRASAALAVGAGGFTLLGLIEDLRGVAPAPRFVAQAAIAATTLPFLLDDISGQMSWKVVFGVGALLWLVAFVNAFNFMDGIDGISVGQTIVAGGAFIVLGAARDVPALTVGGAIAVGVVVSFAPLNFPRALGFLGDSGSYFLGGWLAVLAVIGVRANLPPEAVFGPFAIYLADTATTLVRRVRHGEAWWQPHRSHAYQRLTISGWSHPATTLFVSCAALLCASLGALSILDSVYVRVAADIGIVAVACLYLLAPRTVEQRLGARA